MYSKIGAVLVALCLLLASSICCSAAPAQQESFTEEVVVQPLLNGLVLVHFHFTQAAPLLRHYTTFPKAVGQLVSASSCDEFELSLTQGRWHYQQWGQPMVRAKPAGAEFVAKFSPLLPAASLPAQWGNLSHALGSLFCASLNFVARPEATAVQAISMRSSSSGSSSVTACEQSGLKACSSTGGADTQGRSCSSSSSSSSGSVGGSGWFPAAARQHVLVASLPQEASCTENLTPWLKLLPCRDAAGLGALLASRSVVFGADYHCMQVSLKVERDAALQPLRSTLTQSLTLVLRPPPGTHTTTASSSSSSSSGKPSQQVPAVLADVDLSALLGGEVQQACPLAQQSRLYVHLPIMNQQQQDKAQLLLNIPTYEAEELAGDSNSSATAVKADDAGAGDGEDVGSARNSSSSAEGIGRSADAVAQAENKEMLQQRQRAQRKARRVQRVARAGSWSGPGATLKPAPDAAAVLTHSTPNSGHQQQQQQQQQEGGHQPVHHSYSQLMYVYNLLSSASASARAGGSDQQLFKLHWTAGSQLDGSKGAAMWNLQQQQPRFTATRYITGSGNLHGGMVLELQQAPEAAEAAATAVAGVRNVSVCIFQVVPWQIRLWLHTLQLSIDGKAHSLDALLTHLHVTPAQDRSQPLVLNLCLALPAAARTVTLSAQISKAFLTVAEYPPDAHRGFDVPAAQITFGITDLQGSGSWPGQHGGASSSSSSQSWHVRIASRAEEQQQELPLLQALAAAQPLQVYSPSLVVPLAVPDFSMPYNVICLTSTVLAVFLGAVLGALLLRPADAERHAHASSAACAAARGHKQVKVLLLLVVFGGLGLYLDPSLQEAVLEQLQALGL